MFANVVASKIFGILGYWKSLLYELVLPSIEEKRP
jgi:hypothetical protein